MLRTTQVWVDRAKVRVAYQVKDSYGSVLVSQPSAVLLRLTPTSGADRTASCDVGQTQQPSRYHVSYCALDSLPAAPRCSELPPLLSTSI